MIKEVKLVEIPYDLGAYWRKGASEGPAKIREELIKFRELSVFYQSSTKKNLKDYFLNSSLESKLDLEEEALKEIELKLLDTNVVSKEVFPVFIGGDHSITLAIIRAMAKLYGEKNFGVLQLDAHLDTFDEIDERKYHHGATFKNILEEGLIKPDNLVQLGIRGQVRKNGLDYANSSGSKIIKVDQLKKSLEDVLSLIENKELPYYLSIDIDVVDPSYAPGTGTPVVGGISSYEIINIIREFSKLNLIAADLVEVAPKYDSSNITSLLAASLIYELIIGQEYKMKE